MLLGVPVPLALVLGAGLAFAFGYAQFKGQSMGRGARMGLLLGLAGAVGPAMVRGSGVCCLGGSCENTCLGACVLIGVSSGAAAAFVAAQDPRPYAHGLAAAVMMLFAAGLGCSTLGFAEFLGIAAGLTLGGTTWMMRASRAT